MLSDDGPNAALRRRVAALASTVAEEELPRIPPPSEELFGNLPWASIMADIAIAAAVAEIKVNFCERFVEIEYLPDAVLLLSVAFLPLCLGGSVVMFKCEVASASVYTFRI